MNTPLKNTIGSELERHAQWLQRLALNLVDEEQAALDIAQDTLLVALERPPKDLSRLRPWLAQVLRRRVVDRWRGEGRRRHREVAAAQPESQPDSTSVVARLELEQHLLDAVRKLDEPYRAAVIARHLEGISPTEYARREGIAPGTARWRISEGLTRLRAELDDTFEGRHQWTILYLPFARIRRSASATSAVGGTLFGVWGMKAVLGSFVGLLTLGLLYLVDSAVFSSPDGADRALEATPHPIVGAPSTGEVAETIEGGASVRLPIAAHKENAPGTEQQPASTTRVRLRVIDGSKWPLSGVHLSSSYFPEDLNPVSDSDGRIDIEFEDTSNGRSIDFQLSAEGRAPVELRRASQEGKLLLGSISMLRSVRVLGRVLGAGGEPLPGVRVTAHAGVSLLNSEHLESVETNALGEFEFQELPHGFISLDADVGPFSLSPTNQVVLQLDEDYGHDPVLIRCEDVPLPNIWHGQILLPNNTPAALASLRVRGKGPKISGTFHVDVNDQGRFTIENFDYEQLDFEATANKRPEYVATLLAVKPIATELVIQLIDRPRLPLIVQDPRGVLVTSFSVTYRPEARTTPFARKMVQDLGSNPWLPMPNEAGHFRFRAEGFHDSTDIFFDPTPDVATNLVVTLQPFPILRGRVSRDGQPVLGAQVSLRREVDGEVSMYQDDLRVLWEVTPGSPTTTTDDGGNFAIAFKPDGPRGWRDIFGSANLRWALEAKDESGATTRLDMELPRQGAKGKLTGSLPEPIELVMAAGALRGRLRLSGDRPPEGHWVGIGWGGGLFAATQVDQTGKYNFDNIPPGPLFVVHLGLDGAPMGSIFSTGGRPGPPSFDTTVIADRTSVFDLDLTSKPWLEGSLLVDGKCPGAWSLMLLHRDKEGLAAFAGMGELDGNGTFELEPSTPGPHIVNLFGDFGGAKVDVLIPVEVLAGRCSLATEVTTAGLSGRWNGDALSEGESLRAVVDLAKGGTWSSSLPLTKSGAFSLEAFPLGHVHIEHSLGEDSEPITLLDFELNPGGRVGVIIR